MFRLTDVHKSYKDGEKESRILRGIDLTVQEKELITVMGPSGCGKSTLLNILALLAEPTSGTVHVDGKQVDYRRETELEALRRDKIGLVFQNPNLIGCLNPLENLLLAMNPKSSGRSGRKAAMELLDRVGLAGKYKSDIRSLSGGEAQRVSIVRALVNRPQVLLCDEPTGALDGDNGRLVVELLLATRRETGCALVIVTHDKELGALGERRIMLNGGQVLGMDQGLQAV
ncbi:MAG: macrolide export ATP-binding/permease protein MacB [Paenibacillaceae bacterium]|nr:macrolide export ATP-binding/permease protein MacB [Paenibacillaceae bacterium]